MHEVADRCNTADHAGIKQETDDGGDSDGSTNDKQNKEVWIGFRKRYGRGGGRGRRGGRGEREEKDIVDVVATRANVSKLFHAEFLIAISVSFLKPRLGGFP